MQTYTLNASGKVLGRLASEVARLLRGKNRSDFAPNRLPRVKVLVTNAAALKVTGAKTHQKLYFRHSGYPGGARFTTLGKVFEQDPAKVLRRAVAGMLPKNRLRARLLKQLAVSRGN